MQATIVNLADPKKAVQELKGCAGLLLVGAQVDGTKVILTFREIKTSTLAGREVELKGRKAYPT